MKYKIEDKDVQTVKDVASGYWIDLTDEQSRMLIEKNSDLAADLVAGKGWLDDGHSVIEAILDDVMDGKPRPDNGYCWTWPERGEKNYSKSFFPYFKGKAELKNYKLKDNFPTE